MSGSDCSSVSDIYSKVLNPKKFSRPGVQKGLVWKTKENGIAFDHKFLIEEPEKPDPPIKPNTHKKLLSIKAQIIKMKNRHNRVKIQNL